MNDHTLEMTFDPLTVKHLGMKMYSHLPAALSEIISNSYDAYATKVSVKLFHSKGEKPYKIEIQDDGIGLTFDEINEKFLIIGRNRRNENEEDIEPPFERKPTGKKGLGKLALFGVAKAITIETVKDGLLNEFTLDYETLIHSENSYEPEINCENKKTAKSNGTKVTLKNLKRKSSFDTENLIDNFSRIFIFDENFELTVSSPDNVETILTNERKYETIVQQFNWKLEDLDIVKNALPPYNSISGALITTEKPISPSSGLRGITLYSRGKLVNAPEYFSESTCYLSGWIVIDFVDDIEEDVISTNRQSLVWDFPEMEELRIFLREIISFVAKDWREKRKKQKDKEIVQSTGINTEKWLNSMPDGVKQEAQKIVNTLSWWSYFISL